MELEREVSDLKHQIKMLLWDMKCSGVKPSKAMNELPLETNETCQHSTTQEEPMEVIKLDDEVVYNLKQMGSK